MNYIGYEIYRCPLIPTEYGKYYGKTPIFEQAQHIAKNINGFIKGVTIDGQKIIFL